MTTRQETAYRTFTAGEAIGPALRVKHGDDGNTVVLAGAGELGIGVSIDQTTASGQPLTVRLFNDGGTFNIVAAGVIADKATAYAAASGTIAATGTVPVAINISASVANGWQEVIPLVGVGVDEVYETHVVTSGEAAANSGDGQFDFDTGFGAVPGWYDVDLYTVTTGVKKHNFIVLPLGGSDGTLRITGVDTTAELNEGDILMIHARRTAS